MSTDRHTEVLIVGAGPTGLTLALLLARLGVSFVLIDKAGQPSTTSKAIGLQHRTSELLAWMGLIDAFTRASADNRQVNLYADGRIRARLHLGALPEHSGRGAFVPRPLIIPQSTTEALLSEDLRAAGGSVERNVALTDYSDDGQQVRCQVQSSVGSEVITARFLVSCEGAHSVVRVRSGIAFEGITFPHDFIMADVRLDASLAHDESHSWLHPAGMLTVIALPGERRWRLFIEAGGAAQREVTLALIRELYVERTGDAGSNIDEPTWLTRFKIHSRMAQTFRVGRVFLAGDAAHLHSPSGGQGITTALQDAYNLAWKLAQVLRWHAPVRLLDTYDEERRPAARAVLATTESNTRLLFARTVLGRWLRNHVLLPLLDSTPVQARLIRKLSQLHAQYRGSSLSTHAATLNRAALCAGDRAPDIMLRGADGRQTSLFEQLRGVRFVAWVVPPPGGRETVHALAIKRALERLGVDSHLVRSKDQLGVSTVPALVDEEGELRRLYGVDDDAVILIRPDGYIGLYCCCIRTDVLRKYLAHLWGPAAIEAAFADVSPTRSERGKQASAGHTAL